MHRETKDMCLRMLRQVGHCEMLDELHPTSNTKTGPRAIAQHKAFALYV